MSGPSGVDPPPGDPAKAVRRALEGRGISWPSPIRYLETVGSTNDWLRDRAGRAEEWTAVFAGRQAAGRGRHGRLWLSPAGNLFLSVLIRPRLPPEAAFVVPLAVGVAVREAVAEWKVDAQLKWPNDVVAGGRKLGGILVEGFGAGPGLSGLVVGVGLNLALDPRSLPAELRDQVTSVRELTGAETAVAEAAAAVLARTRGWYDALARDGEAPVLRAWREASVPWWGRAVEARAGESVLRGIARGIDARGALVMQLEDGSEVTVVAGEVRELRLDRP